MPPSFGRLPFLPGRRNRGDRPQSNEPAVVAATVDPDRAPVGPPTLLPASIIRQVLLDSTEITPVWARSRSAAGPEPAVATNAPPAPRPTRRRRTSATSATSTTSGEPKPAAAPQRTRKPAGSRRKIQ